MIARKVAPALAAGCSIVVKPAAETPLSALAMCELAVRAGVPAGVLSCITGDAVAIGKVLTGHPAVRKFSFTGSTSTGKLLLAQCARTVKKTSMELGGNAPFIVFDDADLDEAVQGAMLSKFRNAGQTCVCTNRILVQDGVYERLVAKLAERVRGLRVGDGSDAQVDIGPLVDKRAIAKVAQLVDRAISQGAKVVEGGERLARPGYFFAPALLQKS